MLNPEIKWNEIVKSFAGFGGGSDFYEIYAGASPDTKHLIHVGSVMHLPLDDLDLQTHYSESTAKVFDIYTFSNGYKLRIKIWCAFATIEETVYEYVTGQAYIVYGGSEHVIPNNERGFKQFSGSSVGSGVLSGGYVIGSTVSYRSIILAKTYGLKLALFTEYLFDSQGTGGVVEGVTRADNFGISFFLPVADSGTTGTMNSWAMIQEDALINPDEDFPAGIMSYAGYGGVLYVEDLDAFMSYYSMSENPIVVGKDDEPVQEEDPSGPGGGGGNYDENSDPIPFPELPTGGALASGAIKGFVVSTAILRNMFSILWDINAFDILTQFQKLVDNPMDCIISLHCIPVTPSTTNASSIILGSFDTGVNAPVINNQYLTIDCGSLSIKEFWGSALDYSPYTKTEIYLPFIGIKQLNTDDVMNSSVHIKYNVDVLTGDCLANIMCGNSVLYKFTGNFKQDIPVSGRTNNMLLKTLQGTISEVGGAALGNAVGGPGLGAVIGILSGASTVASSKITTQRSGSIAGSVGLLDDFRPFFIFHRPIQSLASNFKGHKGYPSNITRQLSSVSGYTEVEYINLQNIPNATDAEMNEIKTLLKNGVLI